MEFNMRLNTFFCNLTVVIGVLFIFCNGMFHGTCIILTDIQKCPEKKMLTISPRNNNTMKSASGPNTSYSTFVQF